MHIRILRFLNCLFVLSFLGGINNVKAQTDPTLSFAKGIGNEYLTGGTLTIQNIKIDASGNRYVTGSFTGCFVALVLFNIIQKAIVNW